MAQDNEPQTPEEPQTTVEKSKDEQILPILSFCLTIFLLGLIAALIFTCTWPAAMTAVIWILACFISGSFTGFLFGIPKTLQSSQVPAAAGGQNAGNDYRQLVNTNLTEISDWLTKIIVGLGLVKLTKIPPYIISLGTALADGLDAGCKCHPTASLAFAYGIIVCYFVVGFLFGYLATRLYLAAEFRKADTASIQQIRELTSQVNTAQAQLETTKGQVENLATNQSVLKTTVSANTAAADGSNVGANAAARKAGLTDAEKVASLLSMGTAYMAINAADYGERVRLKEISASEMSNYALNNNLSKDAIIQFYSTSADKNEGLVITVATLVIYQPESGDLDRLLSVAGGVKRKHVQYRILNAIIALMDKKLVKVQDKERITAIAEQYRTDADASLLDKIISLLTMVRDYQG